MHNAPLMSWKQILLLIGAVAAMWSIVPLMVWGGTGDWRRALRALREYAGVMTLLAVAGGGTGLLVLAGQAIG
jgi:hypothetical protein